MNIQLAACAQLTALALLLAAAQQAAADCASASDKPDKCIDVGIPGNGQPPTIPDTEERAKIHKTTNGNPTTFGFALPSAAPGTVYVIFKCQDYDSEPPDCRTPAVKKAGGSGPEKPTWAFKLTKGGVASAAVNSTLPSCDACAAITNNKHYDECMDKFCVYPYMIMDIQGNSVSENPPLDPDIIIDPK